MNDLTVSRDRAARMGLVPITHPFRGQELAWAAAAVRLIRANGGDGWLISSPDGVEVARPAAQVNCLLRRAHALGLDCSGPASAVPQHARREAPAAASPPRRFAAVIAG